jgi:oligopeptide/dipeptide ABC transporter ATP-binding protein
VNTSSQVLGVEELTTAFATSAGVLTAVDQLSFTIERGEIVGLVGSSGSGKSVTAMSIIGLVRPPGRVTGGRILFQGRDLLRLSTRDVAKVRGSQIGMIFQDPVMHLDPIRRVGLAIADAICRHTGVGRGEGITKAAEMLGQLRVPDPERVMHAYPFQLSGGMCQRIMIAIALAGDPDLLIADEATSALDATVQAEILTLLADLVERHGRSLLLTTHNMRIVRRHCHRVLVMYAGRIVESGPVDQVLKRPRHPYTRALLDCMPGPEHAGMPLTTIPGDPPQLGEIRAGCPFRPRCSHARHQCGEQAVVLKPVGEDQHSSCLRAEEIS